MRLRKASMAVLFPTLWRWDELRAYSANRSIAWPLPPTKDAALRYFGSIYNESGTAGLVVPTPDKNTCHNTHVIQIQQFAPDSLILDLRMTRLPRVDTSAGDLLLDSRTLADILLDLDQISLHVVRCRWLRRSLTGMRCACYRMSTSAHAVFRSGPQIASSSAASGGCGSVCLHHRRQAAQAQATQA